MAFQQQQRPQPQRHISIPQETKPASPRKRTLAESEEWILFSPHADAESRTATSQTARTAHLSDFGSLETHIRSQLDRSTEHGDDEDELDSLDDGLHAFHTFSSSSNQLDQSGGAVLPTHDGLGTFSAPGAQNQLWQFEKYNPRRRQRKSSDVEVEDDRTARVEKWRIDQSRAVLEEIQRETQRRRRRMSRMSTRSVESIPVDEMESLRRTVSNPAPAQSAPESWWARITRRVIREIIGIDDTTLSVIFGEAEAPATESRVTFNDPGHAWELRLLERIARELGILVNSLSHEHDTAFSTPPTIPTRDLAPRQPSLRQRRRAQASDISFTPTLNVGPQSPSTEADTSLWGIEEEPEEDDRAQEHWQRDIDLPSIFASLRRHFSARTPAPAPQDQGPLPSSWATETVLGTSPEGLARAESIRRQHPLVHRAAERAAAQHRRRESLLRRHHMASLLQRARGSSCASQSTKRRTRSGGSSRHYWDIGGSDSEAFSGNWGEV